ncbi:hypothetical protein SAMN02927924_01707 [Sphingobium faniae]|nr:hypothetical protein SAMN02927924_01707 [Sphingobium faniae]
MSAGTNKLKNAFRDFTVDGVPSSGINEPLKSDVREGLDIIGSEIDVVSASVDQLANAVNQIPVASAEGVIFEKTKADLDDRAASLGLGAGDAGRAGRVYEDGTAANNGDYRWSGSAWQSLGADRIGKAEAAASTVFNPRYPSVYDKDGGVISSTPEAFFVSREIFARRGSWVLNGTYGIASAELPSHVKLTVQNNLSVIYVDLTDTVNPWKVANYPTEAPVGSHIIIVYDLRSGSVGGAYPVQYASELLKGKISPRAPLAVEGDKLLIPRFYSWRRRDGAFTLHQPGDGSYYFEAPLSTTNTEETRIWFDKLAAAAGLSPIKSVAGNAYPGVIGQNEFVAIIARTLNGTVISDLSVHEHIVDSQFTRGNDPDRAVLYSGNASVVDVTDPDLNALGIYRGVTGTEAFYGGDLPPDAPKKGYYYARVRVLASADNVFQTPRIYVQDGRGFTLGSATMTLEKKISARHAIFLLFGDYSYTARPAWVNLGTFQTTDQVIICAGQFYIGSARFPWIRRDVFPTVGANDMVYGPEMFFVDNRPLPIYPDNIFGARSPSPILSIASPKDFPDVDFDAQAQGGSLVLRGTDLGNTVDLTAISGGVERTTVKRKSVAVTKVTTPVSGSPKIHLNGDSISNRQTGWKLKQILEGWGLTPEWIGTIPGADTSSITSTGGPLGECREGWATTDVIGSDISDDVPNGVLAVGNEAAYLSASKSNKRGFHPFLNPNTGAGSAAPIVTIGGTNYRFDYRFYLNRFSLDDPDIVALNLGMNNLSEGYATMLSSFSEQMPYIIAEMRRAMPSAKILLWSTTVPYGRVGDSRQRDGWSAIQKFLVDHVETLRTGGDSNIHLCSSWAHQSPLAGWGVSGDVMSDPTHPTGTARWQHVEALAAAIANLV